MPLLYGTVTTLTIVLDCWSVQPTSWQPATKNILTPEANCVCQVTPMTQHSMLTLDITPTMLKCNGRGWSSNAHACVMKHSVLLLDRQSQVCCIYTKTRWAHCWGQSFSTSFAPVAPDLQAMDRMHTCKFLFQTTYQCTSNRAQGCVRLSTGTCRGLSARLMYLTSRLLGLDCRGLLQTLHNLLRVTVVPAMTDSVLRANAAVLAMSHTCSICWPQPRCMLTMWHSIQQHLPALMLHDKNPWPATDCAHERLASTMPRCELACAATNNVTAAALTSAV